MSLVLLRKRYPMMIDFYQQEEMTLWMIQLIYQSLLSFGWIILSLLLILFLSFHRIDLSPYF
jgi:hypothetical protein